MSAKAVLGEAATQVTKSELTVASEPGVSQQNHDFIMLEVAKIAEQNYRLRKGAVFQFFPPNVNRRWIAHFSSLSIMVGPMIDQSAQGLLPKSMRGQPKAASST